MLTLLLIAHLLGDFTFQPTALVKKKNARLGFLFLHAVIYALPLAAVCFIFIPFHAVISFYCIVVVSHLLIDWVRIRIEKKLTDGPTLFACFLVDQLLHIAIIVISYKAFHLGEQTNRLFEQCRQWMYFPIVSLYALLFLIILDPTAISIKKLFLCINKNLEQTAEESNPRIGNIIGKLERIIIATLVLCGQYGAIGFVLTAKSIARFRQLEDQQFAEKYLVGTLTSTAIALIATIVIKSLT